MTYMDLFSQRTVQLPSVLLSQKHELAVCSPAPFFCITVQVTRRKLRLIEALLVVPVSHTNVLEGLLTFAQGAEAVLDHVVGPGVDLGLVVVVAPDHLLDGLLDDWTHLVRIEQALKITTNFYFYTSQF